MNLNRPGFRRCAEGTLLLRVCVDRVCCADVLIEFVGPLAIYGDMNDILEASMSHVNWFCHCIKGALLLCRCIDRVCGTLGHLWRCERHPRSQHVTHESGLSLHQRGSVVVQMC